MVRLWYYGLLLTAHVSYSIPWQLSVLLNVVKLLLHANIACIICQEIVDALSIMQSSTLLTWWWQVKLIGSRTLLWGTPSNVLCRGLISNNHIPVFILKDVIYKHLSFLALVPIGFNFYKWYTLSDTALVSGLVIFTSTLNLVLLPVFEPSLRWAWRLSSKSKG